MTTITTIIGAVLALFRKLKAENPVRLISTVLAAVVAAVGVVTPYVHLLQSAKVQTWQAALPIIAGEILRRFVFAPNTVTNLLAIQAAALKASPLLAPVAAVVDAVVLPPVTAPVVPVAAVAAVPVPAAAPAPPAAPAAPPAAA